MKKLNTVTFLFLTLLLFTSPLSAFDRHKVMKAFEKIESNEKQLKEEINELRKLLGVNAAVEDLTLLEANKNMSEEIKKKIVEGSKLYNAGDYKEAKKSFREAWESGPDQYITQYNLGLAYQKIGNEALAKKMLKSALESNSELKDADKIREFLTGAVKEEVSDGSKVLANDLKNLKKEAQSYAKSSILDEPSKIKETIKTLTLMEEKLKNQPALQRDYYLDIADFYSSFEWHQKALSLYKSYEEAMEGKVLPDGYHSRLLQAEEQTKKQTSEFNSYSMGETQPKVYRKLKKDLEELKIFASQFQEFVEKPSKSDSDFIKISGRLKEFRWGNFPNRHVIVANRYQEILYSSLPGTLPLDRYQDKRGRQFLKAITFMADEMKLNEANFFTVDLKVGNEYVPYSILFTYIPKHESFIIVRIPLLNTV
jgi:tetratricopeptide (TPR) repeat protein